MKITIENYQNVFAGLLQTLSSINNGGNRDVISTVNKVEEKINEISSGGDELKKENEVLKIGVVGQVKAGKSSFLNSLFFNGENVLPRASTPMTAGLTILKYSEENKFEVEYYNTREWQSFEAKAKEHDDIIQYYKESNPSLSDNDIAGMANIDPTIKAAKELVSSCGRNARNKITENSKIESRSFADIDDLQSILETYVGANGEYTPIVKSLTIGLNDERLKDIQIVDTPGVNDPVLSREMRTREFLRGCHGVFLLSYSGRFFDSTDVDFLTNRIGNQGIGTVVLIASKFDSVLQDVGMKYPDDLSAAIEYCTKSLKKQYSTNIATSNFNGKDPIMDFSSGIGFSIARKDENRWDEMEQHVVKRMKSFYPSYFATLEDIKSCFQDLSQIDDIREKYIENVFKRNKDNIIQEKVNSYFQNASVLVKEIVAAEKGKLNDIAEALKLSDIGEMEARKKSMKKVIEHVKNDIESLASRADALSEKNKKECLNDFSFRWNGNVPTTEINGSFICKGRLWGTRNIECIYNEVDLNTLMYNLTKAWDEAIKQFVTNWNQRIGSIIESIKEMLQNIITESLNNDKDGLLDGKVLRNILGEIVTKMSNKATIPAKAIKDKFKSDISSQLDGKEAIPHLFKDKKESEAKIAIGVAANQAKKTIVAVTNTAISAQSKALEVIIQKVSEEAISVLKDNKNRFIEEFESNTNEYLTNLETALKDKKKNLQIMSDAINKLNNIETGL